MVTNQEVNKQIAEYFMDDCRSFIERHNRLLESATDRGRRCKLLTEVLFAIECGLKALYFYDSTDDEKTTYKTLRTKFGHNISKLFSHHIAKHPSLVNMFNIAKQVNLDDYGVSLRYKLEAEIEFEDREKYYEMVDELMIKQTMIQIAQKLKDYIEDKYKEPFTAIPFNKIDLNKEIEITNRIRNIAK